MGYVTNNSIERRTPLKAKTAMARSTVPMKKMGRRTRDWLRAWRFLKPRFESAGRTRCEFAFVPHRCGGILTPAHSKKRREMQGPDIYHVAMACINAHRILDEQMTHQAMESAVMHAIENHGGLILPERY